MTRLRVTIDTNVLISGIIIEQGYPFILLEYWRTGTFELVTSLPLTKELESILQRAKIQKYPITSAHISNIRKLLHNEVSLCLPARTIPLHIRDPKDQIVIATALGGKADYLVTGDKDLLAVKTDPDLKSLKIVTAREFIKVLEKIK